MKRLNYLGFIAIFTALIAFSGCGVTDGPMSGSDGPSTEVVQKGISSLYYDVNSAAYEFEISGDVMDIDEYTPNVAFDLSMNGEVDNTNPKAPNFSINMAVNGSLDDGESQSLSAEMIANAKNIYFVLHDISDFEGDVPAEMVAQFLGKWYFMPIPEDSLDTFDIKSEMTPEQEEMKKLFTETNFFKDIKYVGTADVLGTDTHEFSAVLDKDAVKNFLIEVAELDPDVDEPTEADLADLDAFLATFDMNADLFIGQGDGILRSIAGDIAINPVEGGSVVLNFVLDMGNLNEVVTIDAPADAMEFDPMMLLGGL